VSEKNSEGVVPAGEFDDGRFTRCEGCDGDGWDIQCNLAVDRDQ